MKRCLIIAALALLLVPAKAQRYLPKMRGVEVMGGLIETINGFYLHGGYAQYTRNRNRWAVAGEYLQRNYTMGAQVVPLMQCTVEGGFYLKFFDDASKTFFAAAGLLALTGYEVVNKGVPMLPTGALIDNKSAWIYGCALAVELEYYLDDRYVLLLSVKERLSGGSTVGLLHSQFGIGLKYILN